MATVCTHTHHPQGSRTYPEAPTPPSGSSVLSADCLSIDFAQVVVREHLDQDLVHPPPTHRSRLKHKSDSVTSLCSRLSRPQVAVGVNCVVVEVAALPRQALPPVLYLLHSS